MLTIEISWVFFLSSYDSMFLAAIFKDIFLPQTKNTHLPVVIFIHLDLSTFGFSLTRWHLAFGAQGAKKHTVENLNSNVSLQKS